MPEVKVSHREIPPFCEITFRGGEHTGESAPLGKHYVLSGARQCAWNLYDKNDFRCSLDVVSYT